MHIRFFIIARFSFDAAPLALPKNLLWFLPTSSMLLQQPHTCVSVAFRQMVAAASTTTAAAVAVVL